MYICITSTLDQSVSSLHYIYLHFLYVYYWYARWIYPKQLTKVCNTPIYMCYTYSICIFGLVLYNDLAPLLSLSLFWIEMGWSGNVGLRRVNLYELCCSQPHAPRTHTGICLWLGPTHSNLSLYLSHASCEPVVTFFSWLRQKAWKKTLLWLWVRVEVEQRPLSFLLLLLMFFSVDWQCQHNSGDLDEEANKNEHAPRMKPSVLAVHHQCRSFVLNWCVMSWVCLFCAFL